MPGCSPDHLRRSRDSCVRSASSLKLLGSLMWETDDSRESCGSSPDSGDLDLVRGHDDIDAGVEVDPAGVEDEVVSVNCHRVPVIETLGHVNPDMVLVALPPPCQRLVDPFVSSSAGDANLDWCVELHVKSRGDVPEDECAIATQDHNTASGCFLHEASVLPDHLRVLGLGQGNCRVVENGRSGSKSA